MADQDQMDFQAVKGTLVYREFLANLVSKVIQVDVAHEVNKVHQDQRVTEAFLVTLESLD
jgi:hypothetical protein